MTNKEIRKTLLEMDKATDCKYDLTSLYEACKWDKKEDKDQLVKYIGNADPKKMNDFLSNQFDSSSASATLSECSSMPSNDLTEEEMKGMIDDVNNGEDHNPDVTMKKQFNERFMDLQGTVEDNIKLGSTVMGALGNMGLLASDDGEREDCEDDQETLNEKDESVNLPEYVTLHYDDLEVIDYVIPATWEEPEDVELTTIEYDYDADIDEVIDFLWWTMEDEDHPLMTAADGSDDPKAFAKLKQHIRDHIEEFVEQYKDKILEHFREAAENDANNYFGTGYRDYQRAEYFADQERDYDESLKEDWRDGTFTQKDYDEWEQKMMDRIWATEHSCLKVLKSHPEFKDQIKAFIVNARNTFANLLTSEKELVEGWFSDDDVEDDYEHTNLYGGDPMYCKHCGTKLIYDDGYPVCPECNKESAHRELSEQVNTVYYPVSFVGMRNIVGNEYANVEDAIVEAKANGYTHIAKETAQSSTDANPDRDYFKVADAERWFKKYVDVQKFSDVDKQEAFLKNHADYDGGMGELGPIAYKVSNAPHWRVR